MKNLTIVIVALAAFSAYAKPQHSLTGKDAESLFFSLKSTGTKLKVKFDYARVKVNTLSCNSGFQHPYGVYAACDFLSSESKAIHVTGKPATAIFNSIAKSGIRKVPYMESASVTASSVVCVNGITPSAYTCVIEE